jgi:4-amino-4-deoxy-L-arabinose transferase-like glycosyltransferase
MTSDFKKYTPLIAAIFLLKLVIIAIYVFHHPSEIRYASIAMRMALTNNFLMPFFDPETPFFGKPPLSIWASAIFFKIFGFSEFAGRLPHLLALAAICYMLFHCVTKLYDKKTAFVAVLILLSCTISYALHSVMTEAFLLLGMTITSLCFLLQMQNEKKNIYGYLFFIGCAIATLTKGPVGIMMPGLPIFIYLLVTKRWLEFWQKFPLISGTILFLLMTLPWFILAEKSYPGFLEYFLIGENFYRFTKSGWEGDLYGNAHHTRMGMVWLFFLLATLPLSFVFFTRTKKIFNSIKEEFSESFAPKQNILFFSISFLAPMLVLTFMHNMIATYVIYALIPFVVIMARVFTIKKWDSYIKFLAIFTLILHIILIIIFLINPDKLAEHINKYDFLIQKIPAKTLQDKNFKLYYIGHDKPFTAYYRTQDRTVILNEENFDILREGEYALGVDNRVDLLTEEQRQKLNKIACNSGKNLCLYERKNYDR